MPERPRDELWDTLVDVCGADASQMTKSERGRFNAALKELREVGATPEDIRTRAGRYRAKWPHIDLTPTALAANWSGLRPPSPPRAWTDPHTGGWPPGESQQAGHMDRQVHAPRESEREITREEILCTKHGIVDCVECAEEAKQRFFDQVKDARIGEGLDE